MKEFRRISGVLLAAALVLPSLTSCDLVGSLGDLAESLKAEQAQYQGVEGPIDTTPPPIVRPGDGVGGGGKDDPGDEKEPAEITPGEEDPEKLRIVRELLGIGAIKKESATDSSKAES